MTNDMFYQSGVVSGVELEPRQRGLPGDLNGAGEEHQVTLLPDPDKSS